MSSDDRSLGIHSPPLVSANGAAACQLARRPCWPRDVRAAGPPYLTHRSLLGRNRGSEDYYLSNGNRLTHSYRSLPCPLSRCQTIGNFRDGVEAVPAPNSLGAAT